MKLKDELDAMGFDFPQDMDFQNAKITVERDYSQAGVWFGARYTAIPKSR